MARQSHVFTLSILSLRNCNQHQQLTDQSGPPSAAAAPADWLLPVSFFRFFYLEWFPQPSIQTKAHPSSRAGSSLCSLTIPWVQFSRRHRLSPDKSIPGAFPCHSQGTLMSDWLPFLDGGALPPKDRRMRTLCRTGAAAEGRGEGPAAVGGLWAACAGPSLAPPGVPAARSGCWRRGWCSPRRRTASASLSLPAMPKPPWYMLVGGREARRRAAVVCRRDSQDRLARALCLVALSPAAAGVADGALPLGGAVAEAAEGPSGRGRRLLH